MATFIVILIILGTIILSLALWAVFLRIGLRWVKAENVTIRRIALVTGIVFLIGLAIGIATRVYIPDQQAAATAYLLLLLLLGVLLKCRAISYFFNIRFLKAVTAWLVTLISSVLTLFFVILVLKPYIIDAFFCYGNSMAPTLLGHHFQGDCTECGKPAFSSNPLHFDSDMICADFHVSSPETILPDAVEADRFIVVKFITPKRWDIIAFRYPHNPSQSRVCRLVGLPGEEVVIKEGLVWINGEKLPFPDSLKGLEYSPDKPNHPYWGSFQKPAILGPNEYFVLGDFSINSQDSRYWEKGAPDHNPYAVPESYIQGVVTHIYWPISRWRAFR